MSETHEDSTHEDSTLKGASKEEAAKLLKIDHYDFELPQELIAQHPVMNREDARLMTVDRESSGIDHFHIRDMPQLVRDGDCLVLNDTRVIPAQLVGYRVKTRGRWHGLFLESDESGNWRLLSKTRGKIQPGERVILQDRDGVERFELTLIAKLDDASWVARPEAEGTPEELIGRIGRVPLPHYIRGGNMVDADIDDYQTVFARRPGAIAAPTAGLHFTNRLLTSLIDRGVKIARVTLHVGIGTFRPVSADDLGQHQMHYEWGEIESAAVETINKTRNEGGRVIAVGTTSVRVLETAGADGELQPWRGETDLFVRPPFQFNVIDGLLTNFHLPRSTLLVLVRTFGGDKLLTRAYSEAVEEQYRFFSYGDAMLIT
ncbi:MAG: tRNA preQ1(34) S-adenosylmethionine ribosyltransferase-isomerase QueA [Planctomycetota bacterium]